MDQASSSSSGTVKIEYTDPSGLFPLIESDLRSRLPLRNLDWNSEFRPNRSIESLYIELVPDEKSSARVEKDVPQDDSLPKSDENSLSPGKSTQKQSSSQPPKRERRHQIPGLRETAYLKIYLLRCDDADAYKASSRKLIREWIKAHTPPSQSSGPVNNQENHDAFEWMIVHVVIPDLQAAGPWPTRMSTKILDNLRSDFNGSSKFAVDRVAQIPSVKPVQVQGVMINPLPNGPSREQFMQRWTAAWDDVLGKFKSLFLNSFDSRVRQYEEDIKEKGAQRTLPGWNFCTFFVLKEGLARGFESVGLLDDALMGYDELSVELQAAVHDENENTAPNREGGLFRKYTEQLLHNALSTLHKDESLSPNSGKGSISVLDVDKKPYRDAILASDISVYDFRSYVFARQISLLLRLASDSKSLNIDFAAAEPIILIEICRRSVSFIALIGPVMRLDLSRGLASQDGLDDLDQAARYHIIENSISSVSFTIARHIRERIEEIADPTINQPRTQMKGFQPEILTSHVTPMSSFIAQTTLMHGRPDSSHSEGPVPGDRLQAKRPSTANQPGRNLYVLAAQRAAMEIFARRALTALAERQGWQGEWSFATSALANEDLHEISLADVGNTRSSGAKGLQEKNRHQLKKAGILTNELRDILASKESFHTTYEQITMEALVHFQHSGDTKSARALNADLALLRYHMQDYMGAVAHLERLVTPYAESDWSEIEVSILDIYARCLGKLGRNEEYSKVALRMLANGIRTSRRGTKYRRGGLSNMDGVLRNILDASLTLQEPIIVILQEFFSDINVSPIVQHFESQDGFKLLLSLSNNTGEDFTAHKIQLRLRGVAETRDRQIWLASDQPVHVTLGRVCTTLTSRMVFPGKYLVDQIELRTDRIVFQCDAVPSHGRQMFQPYSPSVCAENISSHETEIIVWPSSRSFDIRARLDEDIHLDQPRAILLELHSGQNDVIAGILHLRAGSAGLRLNTGDTVIVGKDGVIDDLSQPSAVCFTGIGANSVVKFKVPYLLENNDVKVIEFKTDVSYKTAEGDFVYGVTHKLSVILPLGVNVQDIFKHNALFSKFSVSTSTAIPLRILGCHLEGTEDYSAMTPCLDPAGLRIFVKQPISIVYRILRKKRNGEYRNLQTRLRLLIKYQCLDDEVLAAVEDNLACALQKSEFKHLDRLLLPFLSSNFKAEFLWQDLELIGLLREVRLPAPLDMRWNTVLEALPEKQRDKVISWLDEWHRANKTIVIPEENKSVNTGHIMVPMDLPETQIVYTARLRLLTADRAPSPPNHSFIIGEAIPAELSITYTTQWAIFSKKDLEVLPFYYEFEVSAEAWIIGGRRRAFFEATEREILTFPLLLFPQRLGHVLLPALDIRSVEEPIPEAHRSDATTAMVAARPPSIVCEVDYKSQGDTVHVVSGTSGATLSIDLEDDGRTCVLETSRKAFQLV